MRRIDLDKVSWIAALMAMGTLLTGCQGFALIGVVHRGAEGSLDAAISGDASTQLDAAATTTPTIIDDCGATNPGGLSSADIATLRSATTRDGTQRYLYPYDGTVFPGGIRAPTVMWAGPKTDALLLRLSNAHFDYQGCLKPSGDQQIAIPQYAWDQAAAASPSSPQTDQPLDLQLTTLSNGHASGPLSQQIRIAGAPFKGSVYYMTYGAFGTPVITRSGAGRPAQALTIAGGCSGCHSLSANGTRMLAYSLGASAPFSIDDSTTNNPTLLTQPLRGGELAGVYPDGSIYVAPAHPSGLGPRVYSPPEITAGLFDMSTGQNYPNAGIPTGALTPAFSPDGLLFAFNDSASGGRAISIMDFSLSLLQASNNRSLVREPAAYPAWPTFTPDSRALVYARGQQTDFSANGSYIDGLATAGPESDLYSVDIVSGDKGILAHAMGYATRDDSPATSYLPFGAADQHQNYYPSLSPVAAGGYNWLFFDSIRNYGNQGVSRQIWGAAIDVAGEGNYGDDLSHPAFYWPEQDATVTNLRPVAVLDP